MTAAGTVGARPSQGGTQLQGDSTYPVVGSFAFNFESPPSVAYYCPGTPGELSKLIATEFRTQDYGSPCTEPGQVTCVSFD